MNLAEELAELVRRVRTDVAEEERVHEVLAAIRALPEIEALSGPLIFRQGAYELQVGFSQNLEKTAKVLAELKPLGLSVAPELLASLPFSDSEGVLVSYYAACAGEKLSAVKAGISEAARARAKSELERLADRGWSHPYAARGLAHWLVSSERRTLVLDEWGAARALDAEERAFYLERAGAVLSAL